MKYYLTKINKLYLYDILFYFIPSLDETFSYFKPNLLHSYKIWRKNPPWKKSPELDDVKTTEEKRRKKTPPANSRRKLRIKAFYKNVRPKVLRIYRLIKFYGVWGQ